MDNIMDYDLDHENVKLIRIIRLVIDYSQLRLHKHI